GDMKIRSAGYMCKAVSGKTLRFEVIQSGFTDSYSALQGKEVRGEVTGDHTSIDATEGDINVNKVGHLCSLEARKNIYLGTAGHRRRARGAETLRFKSIPGGYAGDPAVVEGRHVRGETAGDHAHAFAIEGDIDLQAVGDTSELDADGHISLGTGGF